MVEDSKPRIDAKLKRKASSRRRAEPAPDRASHHVAPADAASGLAKGLTSYGDRGFSMFLRKAFIKGAGYTDRALDRPVIGITNTGALPWQGL